MLLSESLYVVIFKRKKKVFCEKISSICLCIRIKQNKTKTQHILFKPIIYENKTLHLQVVSIFSLIKSLSFIIWALHCGCSKAMYSFHRWRQEAAKHREEILTWLTLLCFSFHVKHPMISKSCKTCTSIFHFWQHQYFDQPTGNSNPFKKLDPQWLVVRCQHACCLLA